MQRPGWYTDSDGVRRFWDGTGWLVSVTRNHVTLKNDVIALDDIRAVAYSRFYGNGNTVQRVFEVRHGHGTTCLSVDSPARQSDRETAWQLLVDISRQVIEPRVAHRILTSLQAGREYSIKNFWPRTWITLCRDGFTAKAGRRRAFAWSDFHTAVANPANSMLGLGAFTRKHDGQVWVYARSTAKKPHAVVHLSTLAENAVVLPILMPMCAEVFG